MLKALFSFFKKKCPECKSTNIENMEETIEGDTVTHESVCHDCGHKWYKEVKIGSADDVV